MKEVENIVFSRGDRLKKVFEVVRVNNSKHSKLFHVEAIQNQAKIRLAW